MNACKEEPPIELSSSAADLPPQTDVQIAVIGGGPAGLRAAEVAAAAGAAVTLFEAKPSPGRKFLVAGRGGLNLTKAEDLNRFIGQYRGPRLPSAWAGLIRQFDPLALQEWAAGLGVEIFAARTGRVYPRSMKGAPLLRRWVQRLRNSGVHFALRHRWTGFGSGHGLIFETPAEPRPIRCEAAIFALGGASWPDTGSDGAWTQPFQDAGIAITPWQPANCGWEAAWPAGLMASVEGHPLKNIAARAGSEEAKGELLITRYGLEGGVIYQLGPALRAMAAPCLEVDLKPDMPEERLTAKLGPARRHLLEEARTRWKLSPAAVALLNQHPDLPNWQTPRQIAQGAKHCPVKLVRPRPLSEAISTAGGVAWSEVDATLMLRSRPGIFLAGEMLDWEAPTGGYLLQACFATGTHAAKSAVDWARRMRTQLVP